jgi:acetyl/propionyl-CoA carboxylase alpha subunit
MAAEGHTPLRTIALFTESERHAPFVCEADEAYSLGPASARPYLDPALERALAHADADAAWPVKVSIVCGPYSAEPTQSLTHFSIV